MWRNCRTRPGSSKLPTSHYPTAGSRLPGLGGGKTGASVAGSLRLPTNTGSPVHPHTVSAEDGPQLAGISKTIAFQLYLFGPIRAARFRALAGAKVVSLRFPRLSATVAPLGLVPVVILGLGKGQPRECRRLVNTARFAYLESPLRLSGSFLPERCSSTVGRTSRRAHHHNRMSKNTCTIPPPRAQATSFLSLHPISFPTVLWEV